MIIVEDWYNDEGNIFKKTYSNAGYVIEQVDTGIRYSEAIDPYDSNRIYIETTERIDSEEFDENYTEPDNSVLINKMVNIILGEEA